MKKLNATLSLVALVLASLTFSTTTLAQQPPDNVQGNWTIYSTNIEDGQTVIKHVQIAQYGNRITGYFEGPIQSGPIQGEVNIHHIRFSTVTRNVLTFRGQIYGDNMSGEYGLHGKHAEWQAVRTTGIGAAPQAMIDLRPVHADSTGDSTGSRGRQLFAAVHLFPAGQLFAVIYVFATFQFRWAAEEHE